MTIMCFVRWGIMLLLSLLCYTLSVSAFTLSARTTSTTWHSIRQRTSSSWRMPPIQASMSTELGTTTTDEDHSHPPKQTPASTEQQIVNRERRKIRGMFQKAKQLERQGRWREAVALLKDILHKDPKDAHSHLALARLQARREATPSSFGDDATSSGTSSKARQAFVHGTEHCPTSVHLWQAWALYEETRGDIERARELFQKALELEHCNPYVCHAYGLMEKKLGRLELARELWERALEKQATAALVCSLGEVMIAARQYEDARHLFDQHFLALDSERERTEVYLAAAWLEEKYFNNVDRAEELIQLALLQSPGNSRAHVALARLEGRLQQRQKDGSGKEATVRRLASACISMEHGKEASPTDGRLFNAWANIEVKARRLPAARKILIRGMQQFPKDQSLFQAAGKVEERIGNYTGARALYGASLHIEPSAPALVAYAMLELRHPETKLVNHTRVQRFFEESLLLDPRHGPAYNAYGNMELRRGRLEEARMVYQRGLNAHCTDAASVFHGLAQLELSLGNVDVARDILIEGLREVEVQERFMDTHKHDRAVFLSHSLGMLELNSYRATEAMAVFQNGITRYGNSSQLLLGAALCEVKLGKEESARNLFERAVHADNRHAQAWQAWGVMEMRAGNITTAKTLFETGLGTSPNHGALWHAYATLEGRMGNVDRARDLFTAGIKKCPRHVPLYQGWASLELRADNLVAAKRLISEALTRDKRQGSGWLIAAQIEERQGNDGLVGLVLRRGIECAPNEAELYRALGEHLVGKGKIQDARQILERGLEVNPLHAPLYHSLAELEARVFNLEGLAKLNARASKLFNNNALVSPTSSSQAWGKKIRMGKSREVPEGVAALAQKVGESMELEETVDEDPRSRLQSMSRLEDELVKDLFNEHEFARRNETGKAVE